MITNHVPKVSYEDCIKEATLFIDVRSPIEFEEVHIPGAINIPLFSNEERTEVGTLYKQVSQEAAIAKGLEIVGPKLSIKFKRIRDLQETYPNHQIVIYCFRGGLRSRSIVSTLNMTGLNVFLLEGGIKGLRSKVMDLFSHHLENPVPFYVLEGHTGTNKTGILRHLEAENYPVIDLEKFANHRGSIFGHIGLTPNKQKQFELLIYLRLLELKNAPFFIIEAESKRIGNVVVPEFILEGKQSGFKVHISTSLKNRVENILSDYCYVENKEELYKAFSYLKKYMKPENIEALENMWASGDVEGFVGILLEKYYDPKYSYTSQTTDELRQRIEYKEFDEAIQLLKSDIDCFNSRIRTKVKS